MAHPQDFITAARMTIGNFDHQAHLANLWASGDYNASLANGANLDILVQVGAASAHMAVEGAVGGDSVGYAYEGPTWSAAGGALTAVAVNRANVKSSTLTLTSGPTLTGVGTNLMTKFLPGGQWWASPGGSGETGVKFILNPNTDYLFRINNVSGAATKASRSLS